MPFRPGVSDEREKLRQKLSDLWREVPVISAAEIGRRLHITKNAVVGMAHRMGLPARPSPIRRGGGEAKPRVERLARPATMNTVDNVVPIEAVRRRERDIAPIIAVAPVFVGPVKPCCWPIGEPKKPSFHFCGAGSLPGKPYCGEHSGIAYVRVRDRREDAA